MKITFGGRSLLTLLKTWKVSSHLLSLAEFFDEVESEAGLLSSCIIINKGTIVYITKPCKNVSSRVFQKLL